MTTISLADAAPDVAPVNPGERIQALDVVRGFALIGIFLMNIEFFNRPISELGLGLPTATTGIDHVAGWLIYCFVQGKFWTMFSLLFGMGFAVMLTRAERAQRNFLRPYLRRLAALAVFGVLHHILIWGGDILFSYAVGATGLLILLYGDWKYILLGLLTLFGLGFIPGLDPLWQVAGGLAMICIAALFLRGEWRGRWFGRDLPLFAIAFLALGALMAIAAPALWLVPGVPAGARLPFALMAAVVLAVGGLAARFHDPVEPRTRRLGVAMYLFPFVMMTLFGIARAWGPQPAPAPAPTAAVAAPAATAAGREPALAKARSKADEQAEHKLERQREEQARAQEVATERRVMTRGSYLEAVRLRAAHFADNAPGEAGFAVVIIGMFLLGAWFVRSGVMENTGAHLPLFRKLVLYCLPLGLALGLLGAAITTHASPGLEHDPYQVAIGLAMMGNLPACLGYVSLIVLMLHAGGALSRIRVLAPLGRMALTNYLTHSVIGTFYFYGYGLGHWGMGRAMQVLFVAVVITLQVIFCHWWLARFRYGPMEWLWRAITYWQLPPMRREAAVAGPALSA
jgi:uncharacterized membrane protein YeiB